MSDVGRRTESSLAWLARSLWHHSPDVTTTFGGPGPRGSRAVEAYAVMPSAARPHLLLPAGSKKVGAGAVRMYGSLRTRRDRLTRALFAAGVRTGVAGSIMRDRIDVWAPTSMRDELSEHLLTEHLRRDIFGDLKVEFAVGMGPRGILRKPVLHVFSAQGQPIAHVKVGWDLLTREAVDRERLALEIWERASSARIIVPPLIGHGTWRDLAFVAISALPPGVRRFETMNPDALHGIREIAEIEGLREASVAGSAYWERTRKRLSAAAEAGGPEVAALLAGLPSRVESHVGDVVLRFGRWHGDFSPWNLGWDDGRLVVWDWELSDVDVPLGFDALHFGFQVAFVRHRAEAARSLADHRDEALVRLAALGSSPVAAEATASLYELELFLRYFEAMLACRQPIPRFYPGILRTLAQWPDAR